jgi:hypothetical protein
MYSNQVMTELRREKALLEHVLALAKCQFELVQTGRIEDFVDLFSLRTRSMSEMAEAEVRIRSEIPKGRLADFATTAELEELRSLNLEITVLVNRIVELDEKITELAELPDAWPVSEASSPD